MAIPNRKLPEDPLEEKVVRGAFTDGAAGPIPPPAGESDKGREIADREIPAHYATSIRKTFNFSPRSRDIWRSVVESMLAKGVVDIGDMPPDTWIMERILQTLVSGSKLRTVAWDRVAKDAAEFQRKS